MITKAPKANKRNHHKRPMIGGVLLFIAIIGTSLAISITPWGLRYLAPLLASRISQRIGLKVEIEGLTLHWPLEAKIQSFTARDDAGEMRLSLDAFRARISMRQLLRKNLRIYRLEVDEVMFAGLPPKECVQEKQSREFLADPSEFESILERAEVRHFEIHRIELAPPWVPEPWILTTHGHWRNSQISIWLNPIALNWNDIDIKSRAPLHIRMTPEHWQMSPCELQVGRGTMLAAGRIDAENIELHADILDFPIERLGFVEHVAPDTETRGSLTVSGTRHNPKATFSLDLDGLRPQNPEHWDGPPARFHANFSLREQRLQGGFQLEDLPGEPVSLDIDIPAPLSLMPFHFDWPAEGAIKARFSANTDLTGLARLFVLDVYHRLVGTLAADIHLSGTFDEPRLDGTINLEGGRYEHELSGTILSDIKMDIAAERDFLSIVHFQASDGGTGNLQARGRMHFRPSERYPFETDLTLNRFRLMQNDHAEALGRGTLHWNGNIDESQLRGEVQMNPMTLNIPETLPPRLYALEVTEIHDTEKPTPSSSADTAPPEAQLPTKRHQMSFDLNIQAPDRVFVRGRGLDSEWSANMQVRGHTPKPVMSGTLDVIRGRFMFFGKRLVIQQGTITFDGAYPPSPLLDIAATIRTRDIIATLRIQGTTDDPDITLQSSPPLPEDEILARILFGRATARLTPWQAITLAQAINNLRGGGSAVDFMGETRRILRVDQIDVRTPDDEQIGTTITVGKYINDRVYVELERGVSEESGRAAVEVELTPTLRLETETGGSVDSGIGIIWTRDY